MGRRPCEAISFMLGANVSDNMGAFHMDISPEVGNLISSRLNRTHFDMEYRAVGTVGIARKFGARRRPFLVTDLSRRSTVWMLPIRRWRGATSRQYHFSWTPTFLTTWGPIARHLPESWKFLNFGHQVAPFSTWILGRGTVGIARKIGARNRPFQ